VRIKFLTLGTAIQELPDLWLAAHLGLLLLPFCG